jgi:hypothetical protein
MNEIAIINQEKFVKVRDLGAPGTTTHAVLARQVNRRKALRWLIVPFVIWANSQPIAEPSYGSGIES